MNTTTYGKSQNMSEYVRIDSKGASTKNFHHV